MRTLSLILLALVHLALFIGLAACSLDHGAWSATSVPAPITRTVTPMPTVDGPARMDATVDEQGQPVPAVRTVAARCYEDQPCWDSRTMGNRQAGVGAAHGPRHGTCERGGVLKRNAAHRLVCDYSRARVHTRTQAGDDQPGAYLVRDARGRLVGVCTPARGCGTVRVGGQR